MDTSFIKKSDILTFCNLNSTVVFLSNAGRIGGIENGASGSCNRDLYDKLQTQFSHNILLRLPVIVTAAFSIPLVLPIVKFLSMPVVSCFLTQIYTTPVTPPHSTLVIENLLTISNSIFFFRW